MSKRKPRTVSVAELKTQAGTFPVIMPPPAMREGIGTILSTYAIIEFQLGAVLHTLLNIEPAEQRIAWSYQHPLARAKVIKSLFEWNGVDVDMKDTINNIDELGTIRDQLAHGVWIVKNGHIFLQTTRDYTDKEIETEKGKEVVRYRHDFLPKSIAVSADYILDHHNAMVGLLEEINNLLDKAKAVQSGRRAAIIADHMSRTAKDADTRSEVYRGKALPPPQRSSLGNYGDTLPIFPISSSICSARSRGLRPGLSGRKRRPTTRSICITKSSPPSGRSLPSAARSAANGR